MGRTRTINRQDRVYVCAAQPTARLQRNSLRRKIVDAVIEKGGKVTLEELEEELGFDVHQRVKALVKTGWLGVEE